MEQKGIIYPEDPKQLSACKGTRITNQKLYVVNLQPLDHQGTGTRTVVELIAVFLIRIRIRSDQ